MKFGSELHDRSIFKWRNYNIDYNELKLVIRRATSAPLETEASGSSSETTQASPERLSKLQKKSLKLLYNTFQEQIDFVSLFVDAKAGELSRRLGALKKQCNLYIKNYMDTNERSEINKKLDKRKIAFLQNELELISKELQDLSRFIMLQKIALKKLFKKFLKHSSYTQKQQLVDKITNKFLLNNSKSFINVNITDLASEVTLLFDFLGSLSHDINTTIPSATQIRHRQTSIYTLDSLELPLKNLASSSAKCSLLTKTSTFDVVCHKKGPRSMTFWVHEDNLDEIKFFLSSHFRLISDDTTLLEQTQIGSKVKERRESAVKLKNARSILNIPEFVHNANDANAIGSISDEPEFRPETETLSIWLNNSKNPFMVQRALANYSTIDNTAKIFQAAPFSHISLSNVTNYNDALLITPIGGLRQFSIADISQPFADYIFSDKIKKSKISDELKDKIFEKWASNDIKSNPKMAEIAFDWVIDNKVEPLAKYSSQRLRYIDITKENKIDCFISLDWDIKSTNKNVNNFSNDFDDQCDYFKHAILELHFDCTVKDLPEYIKQLINSHLVYQIDNLNFSFNNYLVSLYASDNIKDSAMLKYIVPWFDVYENQDIRKLPIMKALDPPTPPSEESNNQPGILLNKNDVQPPKPGYWNEFDNGSDCENDNAGFYVYTSESEDDDRIMGCLSQANLDKVLEWANELNAWFRKSINGNSFDEEALLTRAERHYSIYVDDSDDDTPFENHGRSKSYGAINHLESIEYSNHDSALTFIYVASVVFGFLLSGIGVGLIFGVFDGSHYPGEPSLAPDLTVGFVAIVSFAVICLLVSFFLSIASLCLMLCRYKNAPIWHHCFIWSGIVLNSLFLVLGISIFL